MDPASCDEAQAVIKAEVYYTAADNGLDQDWRAGSVYINPPFTKGLVEQYADKLIDALDAGRVKRAVWLSNNSTETAWFQRLAKKADAIFFPAGRLSYWRPGDDPDAKGGTAMVGDALLYFGKQPERFAEVFWRKWTAFVCCRIGGIKMAVSRERDLVLWQQVFDRLPLSGLELSTDAEDLAGIDAWTADNGVRIER